MRGRYYPATRRQYCTYKR